MAYNCELTDIIIIFGTNSKTGSSNWLQKICFVTLRHKINRTTI